MNKWNTLLRERRATRQDGVEVTDQPELTPDEALARVPMRASEMAGRIRELERKLFAHESDSGEMLAALSGRLDELDDRNEMLSACFKESSRYSTREIAELIGRVGGLELSLAEHKAEQEAFEGELDDLLEDYESPTVSELDFIVASLAERIEELEKAEGMRAEWVAGVDEHMIVSRERARLRGIRLDAIEGRIGSLAISLKSRLDALESAHVCHGDTLGDVRSRLDAIEAAQVGKDKGVAVDPLPNSQAVPTWDDVVEAYDQGGLFVFVRNNLGRAPECWA